MSEKQLNYQHAIETMYRDYLFRSRLEAKWAAFFDLCGWASWSYEPLDFNGWIPDFAIGAEPTLVECKPFFHEHEWSDVAKQVADSKCNRSVILLGADPTLIVTPDFEEAPRIGWLLTYARTACLWSIETLNFGWLDRVETLGLCSLSGGWHDFVSGISGKLGRVEIDPSQREEQFSQRWATACNTSRWMPIEASEAVDVRRRPTDTQHRARTDSLCTNNIRINRPRQTPG